MNSREQPSRSHGDLIALTFFAATKLVLIAVAGPVLFPDSAGYLALAGGILDGSLFTAPIDVEAGTPTSALRTIGYPLVLAAGQVVAGDAQLLAVVALQSMGTCWVFWMGYRIQDRLIGKMWAAIAYTVLATVSAFALYDLAVLADSLSATLMAAVLFAIVGMALGLWRIGFGTVALMGAAWGVAVIIRPPNLYFAILPIVGLCLLTWLEHWSARRASVSMIVLLIGIAAPVQAHIAWNEVRSGERFLSTLGASNWLWPVFNIRATGLADPFPGDEKIDELGRASHDNSYVAQAAVLSQRRAEGLTTSEIESETFSKMIAAVTAHPLAYAVSVINNFDIANSGSVIFNPRQNVRRFVMLGPLHDTLPHLRGGRAARAAALETPTLPSIADAVLLFAARTVAITLFLAFLIGTPVLVVRAMMGGRARDADTLIVGYFWLCYGAIAGAYSLIHLEERMLLPVILPAVITGLWVADRLCAVIVRRRHPVPAS